MKKLWFEKTDLEIARDVKELLADYLNHEVPSSTDLWHPDFGWVLKNGETTDTTEALIKALEKQNKLKDIE